MPFFLIGADLAPCFDEIIMIIKATVIMSN